MKTPKSATDIKVGGKTPEEIKKGLAACSADECHGQHEGCTYQDQFFCTMRMCGDALAYIQQLETELDDEKNKNEILIFDNDKLMEEIAQVERERDAAVHDMENYAGYGAICKHFDNDCPHIVEGCPLWPSDCESYEWRGVCGENTKEETDA